jgi:hypothetical protein
MRQGIEGGTRSTADRVAVRRGPPHGGRGWWGVGRSACLATGLWLGLFVQVDAVHEGGALPAGFGCRLRLGRCVGAVLVLGAPAFLLPFAVPVAFLFRVLAVLAVLRNNS